MTLLYPFIQSLTVDKSVTVTNILFIGQIFLFLMTLGFHFWTYLSLLIALSNIFIDVTPQAPCFHILTIQSSVQDQFPTDTTSTPSQMPPQSLPISNTSSSTITPPQTHNSSVSPSFIPQSSTPQSIPNNPQSFYTPPSLYHDLHCLHFSSAHLIPCKKGDDVMIKD